MLDNVALNVVIGLVFVYLLYSLFATFVSEIIATQLGLRARNLREAINRMLNDEEEKKFWQRLGDSLSLMKKPKNNRIKKFYNNPEIKYLGSSGVFRNPSSFPATSFSRTLLYELNGSGPLDKDKIKKEILHAVDPVNNPSAHTPGVTGQEEASFDPQSAQFVLSLYNDSWGDLVKFRLLLEAWFDRTMEQATEWYKRKIRIILLVLGFFMAWFFNADTFTIIEKLSTDKAARENMVKLAVAYNQSTARPSGPSLTVPPEKLDSLLNVKKILEKDMQDAQSILGSGAWLPDKVMVSYDSVTSKKTYTPLIDSLSLSEEYRDSSASILEFNPWQKWAYVFRLIPHHFFGFLITAIAISLGAPFWFDLLNKLMKLRTSIKQDTNSTERNTVITVSPLNREG